MWSIIPVCPCPDDHNDSGRIEKLISACRARLSYGMTLAEAAEDVLASSGATRDEVAHAVFAAKILNEA